MFTAVTTGLIVFVIVALFLFVSRRIVSLAFKLAVVGLLVILLASAGAYSWWRGWLGSASSTPRPAPQSNQRPNTNRRSR